jgi:hypothetical protein
MDERDRDWRERDWRRSETYGRGGAGRGRQDAPRREYEAQSWPLRDEEDDGERSYDRDLERLYGDGGRSESRGEELRPIYRDCRGLGPKGYQRSDERISDEVHDRLTEDPWLDASNVVVEVKGGEITLNGHVDSREAKHWAERLVEDLSGVRHVQNNLRVDLGADFTGAGRGFGSSAVEAEMRRNAGTMKPKAG